MKSTWTAAGRVRLTSRLESVVSERVRLRRRSRLKIGQSSLFIHYEGLLTFGRPTLTQ